jgi:hypothetical protein
MLILGMLNVTANGYWPIWVSYSANVAVFNTTVCHFIADDFGKNGQLLANI